MGVLLDAVKSDFEPGKALVDTFVKFADMNFKRQKREADDREKLSNLGIREQALQLREQEFGLKSQSQELLNRQRELDNIEKNNKIAEANNFTKAVQAATHDGKTLYERLYSSDAKESEEAFHEFSQIRTDFPNLNNPVVQRGIEKMAAAPIVVAKQKMAEQKAFDQQTAREARTSQGERRLDQQGRLIDSTVEHRKVTEGIGQQNADTRQAGTESRISATNRKSDLETNGIKLPTGNRMTVDEVRKTLAKGSLPTATPQEKTDAATLESNLRRIPSGEKDVMGNPKYRTDLPIDQWKYEGRSQLNLPPPPGFGDMRTQEAKDAPQRSPNPMDVLPDTSGPASPVDSILRKYKIPTSRPQSMADPQPAADLLNTTQNFLADLGVAPAPAAAPVGFGGFGLPSA